MDRQFRNAPQETRALRFISAQKIEKLKEFRKVVAARNEVLNFFEFLGTREFPLTPEQDPSIPRGRISRPPERTNSGLASPCGVVGDVGTFSA